MDGIPGDDRLLRIEKDNNLKIKSIADQLKGINFNIDSLKKISDNIFTIQKDQKEGQEANKKELQGIGSALKKQAQDDQKQRLTGISRSLREGIAGSLKSVGDVVGKSVKSVLGGFNLGDILKGLGLFTLIANPEAFAKGIKSIADAVVGLAKVLTSEEFKKGMEGFFNFVIQVAKFGIDRISQFLDGFAGVSKGIKDLLEGGIFNVDWADFVGDIGNVAVGLGGLALIVAPGATLAVGLKVISTSIGVIATGFGSLATSLPIVAGALAGIAAFVTEQEIEEERRTGQLPLGDDPVIPGDGRAPGWWQLFIESVRRGGLGQAFQTGSFVPGSGDGDKVPAMLEPGEYVLNKKLVSAMGVDSLNTLNFGMVPRFQTGGEVVEYLTGDRSHHHYRADHGGGNYHEHVAFSSREQRDSAIRALESAGFYVGSTDRHQPGSYHHVGQALDVPFYPNAGNLGYTDDRAGEEKFSADVRRARAKAGYTGSGVMPGSSTIATTTPTPTPTTPSPTPSTPTPTPTTPSPTTPGPTNLLAGLTSAIDLGDFAQMFDVLKGLVNTSSLSALLPGSPSSAATLPPSIGSAPASAKQMYDYIKSKGFSDAQAKGLVANIQRESSFRLDAVGDGGNSFGLFQWNAPAGRSGPMMAAVPDWKTNWKAQIDYALKEDVGPQYLNATSGMTAQQAADWWMRNWERSAHQGRDSAKHTQFLSSYQFKTGGLVPTRNPNAQGGGYSMRTVPSAMSSEFQSLSRQSRASGLFDLGGNSQPIVIPVPIGGGGGDTSGSTSGTATAPALPAAARSSVSADYISRVSFGITLS